MKVNEVPKRLKRGHYTKGCEPYGCCNTGIAWCIGTSEIVDGWFVAKDLDFYALKVASIHNMRKRKHKLAHGFGCHFKTRASAVKKWQELNGAMIDDFRKIHEHVKQLRERARKGDMKATLELSDY